MPGFEYAKPSPGAKTTGASWTAIEKGSMRTPVLSPSRRLERPCQKRPFQPGSSS